MRIFYYISILLVGLCSINAKAQQQPVTDLYQFEGLTINPGYAGSQGQISATIIIKDQWANFPGSPVTQLFTAHTGFKGGRHGAGLLLSNDKIGIHQDFGLYGIYAFKIVSNVGTLSLGLQGGFNYLTTDFSLLNLKDQTDQLLQGKATAFTPNFGSGVYYNTEDNRSYLGFSVPYILAAKAIDVDGILTESKRNRYYYLYGGTKFKANNFQFHPSALVRIQEGAPITFDLTAAFVLYDVVRVGGSFRLNDSFISFFEIELFENLHLGYAYESTLSEIRKYSAGSHEIMLNYRLKIDRIHGRLTCPAYY